MPCRRLFVALALIVAQPAAAQSLSQRGFIESRAFLFAQAAPNDPTREVGDLLVRDEVFAKPAPWIRFAGGVELRANTHDQVDDEWAVDAADRGLRRPRLSIRRLTATLTHGGLTFDVGKQFIRWGKTDIVNPTDRFAPRDFLNVVDNEFLGVTGARAAIQLHDETLDVVWLPRFTPSRIPLLTERWAVVPPAAAGALVVDAGARFPRGSQTGVRWSHVGAGFETSLSFFNGFNHLPDIERSVTPAFRPEIDLTRVYPAVRMYGADAAVPTRWFTVKAETAYFTSKSPTADEFVLYVVQLERQTGEWALVGGYAGEAVMRRRAALTFAPDRGLTRSLVGRASYTIDPIRSVAFEGAVRQNGHGGYVKIEYSQAHDQHWRATISGALIGGRQEDFLGQYRRNSHLVVALRYSF
jgi:hypothetical protein